MLSLRWIALIIGRKLIQVLAAILVAAGLAALMATLATLAARSAAPWLSFVLPYVFQISLAFLIAAGAAFRLLPRAVEMIPRLWKEAEPDQPIVVTVLLIGLCVFTALQVPALVDWWAEARLLLAKAFGSEPDRLGLTLIPAAILYAAPFLGSVALVTFVLSSIVAVLVRADLTSRVLLACLSLQAGLVIGAYLALDGAQTLGTWVQQILTSASDASLAQAADELNARRAIVGGAMVDRLLWVLGGYAVAAAVATTLAPRPVSVPASQRALTAVAPSALPVGSMATAFAAPSTLTAGRTFESQTYVVTPQRSGLGSLFYRRFNDYGIRAVPAMAQNRFSFAWDTGILRRDPDGPDLLSVKKRDDRSWYERTSYTVTDLSTGAPMATLVPHGADWEIQTPQGETIARVTRELMIGRPIRYTARVGEHEVCRFTWAMMGLSTLSGELNVEFTVNALAPFDRSLGIALAPILEQKARLGTERI